MPGRAMTGRSSEGCVVDMYVAFLRGMNLGRRRIRNDELCACFDALGFGQVSALLASGNVLFASKLRSGPKLEAKVEQGLAEALGYPVPTFVRSAAEVGEIAEHAPFAASLLRGAGKLQVALLKQAPSAAKRKAALAFAGADDRLALAGRELYWLPRGNMSDSELDVAGLGKLLGGMTIRTHRTLLRLSARLAG
jgi:uncharacterized protein (DUF1697 family)